MQHLLYYTEKTTPFFLSIVDKLHNNHGVNDPTFFHSCCVKFPDVAGSVIPVLMVFLGDSNELAAIDVLVFVREAVTRFTDTLGKVIIEKLLQALSTINSAKIHRQVWPLFLFSV